MKPEGNNSFTLVLGGARSGKSAYALKLAEELEGPRTYLATAEALDAEMSERIRKHRAERGAEWRTVEEPEDVSGKISSMGPGGVVLLDCITLWLTNLIGNGMTDTDITRMVDGLARTCVETELNVVIVSNDVGSGVVPGNPLGRRFVDLSGLANQRLAGEAGAVYMVTAGIPVKIK